MAVSEQDVRDVAALARLGIERSRLPSLVRELNGILEHMEALSAVDPSRYAGLMDARDPATVLRPDEGPPLPLAVPREANAPAMRDGFFLVPRLATHEGEGERSP